MTKNSLFSGKRFLITQPMIRGLNGSTMVTLELASFLKSCGAKVVVYTNIALDPALSLFKKAEIRVITPQEKMEFSVNDFDYIWVHSLTLPRSLLDDLKIERKKNPPFIFLHMSALDQIPDEHPWIYQLEEKLSSLSLYISDGTLTANEKYGLPKKVGFYRNPAPVEFAEAARKEAPAELKRLLVVSNHPPKEVLEATEMLEKRGVVVDKLGEGQAKYSLVTPELLKKYDAVITIGKTVQYCLMTNTPVYIYDHFGGEGWLTPKNYDRTKSFNFSGRFTSNKPGAEIAEDLINGFSDAVAFQNSLSLEQKEDFMIDRVLEKILTQVEPRKLGAFDSEYIETVKAAELCSELRFIASEELGDLRDNTFDVRERCNYYKNELEKVTSAKSYRIFNTLLKPYKKLRSLGRKQA
ncbi:MAG: hypothetical protein K6G36_00265 [Candidatus Saccharibacteria bacterium]|nr:hypothetical protein [Candidatus Saccharibacteria bacterium]